MSLIVRGDIHLCNHSLRNHKGQQSGKETIGVVGLDSVRNCGQSKASCMSCSGGIKGMGHTEICATVRPDAYCLHDTFVVPNSVITMITILTFFYDNGFSDTVIIIHDNNITAIRIVILLIMKTSR